VQTRSQTFGNSTAEAAISSRGIEPCSDTMLTIQIKLEKERIGTTETARVSITIA